MVPNLPKLIGHRGIKDICPENTLQSIYQAVKFNLKWIEIDVKISKDYIPFLLHDDDLERTTSGTGNPYNLEYREILHLDAGSWFGREHKDIHPPTLKEVLDYCSYKKIGVNIELKPNTGFEKANVYAKISKKNLGKFDTKLILT